MSMLFYGDDDYDDGYDDDEGDYDGDGDGDGGDDNGDGVVCTKFPVALGRCSGCTG